MKHYYILIVFLFLLVGKSWAQENYTVSGSVKDAQNGETLLGASVYFKGTNIGVMTNEYGFYSLSIPKGKYTITVSYLGYANSEKEIELNKNQKLNFEIKESTTSLGEVIVTGEESEKSNISIPQMSVVKLKSATIKQIPVVLGEIDIIKSLQILPGVTNNGEGSSGFNVRGGAVDQNLVLLDEAIIYNSSHLLGFFSVFNADAIKDIKLYKGGIPAKFGGRVSSVLDIRQKDGNQKHFSAKGGIGIISSRLALEGPMLKNKGSFLVAGRTSYAHLFLKLSSNENSASFYDLNLKTHYDINRNNKLYLSGYFGRDNFSIANAFENSYGNLSGNLRWNHIFSNKLFSNLSFIYSKYDYQLGLKFIEFDWISDIKNYNLKYDFKYYANDKIKLDFGLSGILYKFNPGEIKPTTESSAINYKRLEQKKAFESAVYINAEHKLNSKLSFQYGLRYSQFVRLGGQHLANYKNDLPVYYNTDLKIYQRNQAISSPYYSNNKKISSFDNWEPRLGILYKTNKTSSIKAAYSKTSQYIHLLSNTSNVTPLDVWTPSGKYVKPQLSDQYSIGFFKDFKNNIYSFEVETYYKTIDNRIDYIDGSDLIGNDHIETEILSGKLRAYGLEFLLRKNKGRFTGWLAYTLSKAEQKTSGGTSGGPGINNGKWYKASHDRTHDISLTGAYKLNSKLSLSANFIFQTGRPVTYPNGQYQYEGLSIASYSLRNSNRLPAYHRVDLALTYKPNRKPQNRWKGEWVFGIYNLYNRYNAASITFGQNTETGINEATRTSIFGIVPSVSYNFKF